MLYILKGVMTLVNKVTIDETVCKGCGLCAVTCPHNILQLDMGRLNAKGYHPSTMTAQEKCIACAMCAIMIDGW
jgi:2-oxoglutarate ferredoxin oxidoreductase subunit delta